MMITTPLTFEDAISQVPALQLLQTLGYKYLSRTDALAQRGGKQSRVLLEGVLADWLRKHNFVRYKGEDIPFSEGNIAAAIQALTEVIYDGLVRTNEKIYDLLCLGKSLPQTVLGDTKSYSLNYIDWENPENNVYHVTEEFSVERHGGNDTHRPDVVLFVNGIPFAVIECKSGKKMLQQAVEQQIGYQKDDGIPHLYQYAQLLLAVNKNDARYATVGTPANFWAVWREDIDEAKLSALINAPTSAQIMANRPQHIQQYFSDLQAAGPREVTGQDRVLYCLCRPKRLLELTYRYIVYDAGEKKIARYQQYFCVKETLARIQDGRNERGARRGGVVWHTQGSGKSLTMVMLAKGISLLNIGTHKIVLVTDRVDLDLQIYDTFKHCGRTVKQARSGRDLAKKLQDNRASIITTVIDKFENAVATLPAPIDDENIFVLVDESHRGQYGQMHSKMRVALPRACYLGFTGTPVMKRDKSTVEKFGGYVHIYNIQQAVDDKAVVPLIYEGRHAGQTVYGDIDYWFGLLADGLSEEETRDLKRKFSTADQLNKAEQRVKRIAYDISKNFQENWQGTGFKAQLVAPDKMTALLYHRYIQEAGTVTSQVLISGPDVREGETDVYEESKDEVRKFWTAMMLKYGNESQYNKQLIQAFKNSDEPEIIIVVDKLLTGFDAPRNTALYLCRRLKDHTLLQAIARVNRLYEGKEFGFILDYFGVLEDLDNALNIYAKLPEFAKEDLDAYANTLTDISTEIAKLPQRHADLWDIFKGLNNKYDEEAYEVLLADEALRPTFYERLTLFAKTLVIALSAETFHRNTSPDKIANYQRDMKFFEGLRTAVRLRYAEKVDYKQYEPRIRKLINQYIGAEAVDQIVNPVDIFNEEAFQAEVERITGEEARADTIAHRAVRTCKDHMDEDPAFYKKFSKLLQEAIDDFRANRLKASEYLKKVAELTKQMVHRTDDDIPEPLRHRDVAKAYYGCINTVIAPLAISTTNIEVIATEAALNVDDIITRLRMVNWTANTDVQNQMRTEIEDGLFDLKDKYSIDLSFDQIDEIIEESLKIAKVRMK
ncbi:MAG: type I restriction endonuclease subunit R [bacterium]